MKRLSFLQTAKIRFFSETMPSYAKKNMYRIVQQQEWTATMQWWPSVPPPLHKPLRIANPPQRGNHCGLQIRFSVVADCKSATAGTAGNERGRAIKVPRPLYVRHSGQQVALFHKTDSKHVVFVGGISRRSEHSGGTSPTGMIKMRVKCTSGSVFAGRPITPMISLCVY